MTLRTTLALAGAIVAASFAMPAFANDHGTQNTTQKTPAATSTGTHDSHLTPTGNGVATQKTTNATHEDTTTSDEKTTTKNEHGTTDHTDDHSDAQGETKATKPTKTPASPH